MFCGKGLASLKIGRGAGVESSSCHIICNKGSITVTPEYDPLKSGEGGEGVVSWKEKVCYLCGVIMCLKPSTSIHAPIGSCCLRIQQIMWHRFSWVDH